jgi:hypothetical protein
MPGNFTGAAMFPQSDRLTAAAHRPPRRRSCPGRCAGRASELQAHVTAGRGRWRRRGGGSLARAPGDLAPIPRPLEPPRHSPHPQALPACKGAAAPATLNRAAPPGSPIQWQRRLSQLPLKEDLVHQLPQLRQGAETAAIAEINQGLGARRLEIGAARLVRMGHEGRSAGHRQQGGAGSRTRAAGLARSLSRPAPWRGLGGACSPGAGARCRKRSGLPMSPPVVATHSEPCQGCLQEELPYDVGDRTQR